MIRQIKTRLIGCCLIAFVCLCGMLPASAIDESSVGQNQIEQSDVVENKSVIEEQICETPMPEVLVNKVETNTQEEVYVNGWTTTKVNVRKDPDLNATILATFDFNTQIEYADFNEVWAKIKYEEDVAYVAKDYISDTESVYLEYEVPEHKDFKSYMGYKAITNKSSKQYQIQSQYAYTGDYGIRMADSRFLVALGSYFGVDIGQYFDLVLENGTIIPCIMGDAKANQHTDSQNIFSMNGCCSEFIIDEQALNSAAKNSGNISNSTEEWKSPVKYVRVYDDNILN